METFCKDCKYIKEPVAIQDAVGKTYGPFTCESELNISIQKDWYGNDVRVFEKTPYVRNKEHNCYLYENALTGELNPEPIPEVVVVEPEIPVDPTPPVEPEVPAGPETPPTEPQV